MKTVLLAILFTAASAYAQNGLGKSTLTCLDIDGDGYGQGPSCTGPDADDTDSNVHSSADVTAKYGSINAFLIHLGYQSSATPATVWCISTTGNDSAAASSVNADTACANPYQHFNGSSFSVISHLVAPYIVLFRSGTYTQAIYEPPSGTPAMQNVFMSYPGEKATLDMSAGTGNAVSTGAKSYITVDGLKIVSNPSGSGYAGGTYILYGTGSQAILFVGNVLRRCEISGGGTDSNVDADNVTNFTVEECIIHDPYPTGGQHNIYIGSNTVASTGVIIRRNILYNVRTGGYPNLQFNGRCTACYFDDNLLYNADGQQIALLEGVSNSFVRNNLVFNTGEGGNPPLGFTLANYDQVGQCQVTGQPSICAWDQTGNVIENNTFWSGNLAPDGSGGLWGETFEIANNATAGPCGAGGPPPCGNLGGNLYRNNIIVDLSAAPAYPPIYYASGNPVNYLALDTWTDNIIYGTSSYVAGEGGTPMTCSAFSSAALSGSGCSAANPGFVAANASFYNSPTSFNFNLTSGSPAIGAGTAVGAPMYDFLGNLRANPPAIGALETVGIASPLSSLTCAPANLTSGATSSCTVTLGQAAGPGGATVALSSSSVALTVPANVTVGAGGSSATFSALAGAISSGQTAIITATFNGASQTAVITLVGPAVLTSIACSPSILPSATAAACSVTLSGATGATVALSSSASALTVPASVVVAAGATTAAFSASAGTVSTSQIAVITATLNGGSQTASLTLIPSGVGGSGSGTWKDLLSTTMQAVCPANNFGGIAYNFFAYCPNIVNAWGGGIADTRRNRLIVWGGGHSDYFGNELYALNLAAAPPTMTRLTDPSAWNFAVSFEANADGTPTSRHTYNDLVYLPVQDALFSFSGGLPPNGTGTNHTWMFTFADNTWHTKDPVNGFDPTTISNSSFAAACAYDPNTQTVFCIDGNTNYLLQYNPATNTYTKLSTDAFYPYAGTAAIDPARKLMVFMGSTGDGVTFKAAAIDISGADPTYTVKDWTTQVTGCAGMATNWPGFVYDSAISKFVGYPTQGSTVYIFDAGTKTCVPQNLANGPQIAPASNGTFGRFQYFPSLDTFALVNSANLDALSLTLSPGTPTGPSCDLNSDGVVNNVDVQIAANQVLGISPCASADLEQNGQCSVVDIQRVINASLGAPCLLGP